MPNPEVGKLFFKELEKLSDSTENHREEHLGTLFNLFKTLIFHLTQEEKIAFTTLFSRMAFAFQKVEVPGVLQRNLHLFRKKTQRLLDGESSFESNVFWTGLHLVAEFIGQAFSLDIPPSLLPESPVSWALEPSPSIRYYPTLRVIALADRPEREQLLVEVEEWGGEKGYVQYNLADRNDQFMPTIRYIIEVFGFPISLNLLEVEQAENHLLRPTGIVVAPDYLMDVTAVAGALMADGLWVEGYILRKFLPVPQSEAILIGHIANFMLDQLLTEPEQDYNTLFPKVFHLYPLSFALLSDSEVKRIYNACRRHFQNLKKLIRFDFATHDLSVEKCYLEPAFYVEKYGLQGRLDVLYRDEEEKKMAMVELKSGKLFKPNAYRINRSHFVQTTLYEIMIREVFPAFKKPLNFLFYSGSEIDPLRFAPFVKAKQMEALQVRNYLMAMEWIMMDEAELPSRLLHRLDPRYHPKKKGFVHRDLQAFSNVYRRLSAVEKHYFHAFCSFIAREQQMAKCGNVGGGKGKGLSSLWQQSQREKEDNFEMWSNLKLKEVYKESNAQFLKLEKTDKTNPLANFRIGDIGVIYPKVKANATVLDFQVFKCTIISLEEDMITVQLRYPQFNTELFGRDWLWHIEFDLLDSSFTSMYRQLFSFASAALRQRSVWLGLEPPQQPILEEKEEVTADGMTSEQHVLVNKILQTEDYFLLWGPPGTGKTSVMIKHISGALRKRGARIMLLAYTNKAVDEICDAVLANGDGIQNQVIRIGSRQATNPVHHPLMLKYKLEGIASRKGLVGLLKKHSIYIGTIASVSNKPEIFKLLTFDWAIIDEASQLIEPAVIGLLPRFKKVVMVGDHKQLPAVVQQHTSLTRVVQADLQKLGIKDLRQSLFERLFTKARQEGWTWAYGMLHHQGRMHEEVMAFPNEHFYEGQLEPLPVDFDRGKAQRKLQEVSIEFSENRWEELVGERRVLFFPIESEEYGGPQKVNKEEARQVGLIIKTLLKAWAHKKKAVYPGKVGVITPFRAQIAQIKHVLDEEGLEGHGFDVDTVERFQGSARDVIIISLCASHFSQLEAIVGMSSDGINRKFNVALTRAREQVIVLGNPRVLAGDTTYRAFMERYQVE